MYLALVYHLGRPGSELDPVTKQPAEHGLREMKVALGSELAADSAIIELDDGAVAEAALGDLRLRDRAARPPLARRRAEHRRAVHGDGAVDCSRS